MGTEKEQIIAFLNTNPKPENGGYISKLTISYRSNVSLTFTYWHLLALEKEGIVERYDGWSNPASYWKLSSQPV